MLHPSSEVIARVPLFSGLDRRELERVADAFKERRYRAGETMASEGQKGVGFFVIAEGTASVSVGGEPRGSLGPGDHFGEIALIDEGARTATIVAETDLICYGMTFWDFKPVVEADGRIAWKLLQALAGKLRAAEQRTQ